MKTLATFVLAVSMALSAQEPGAPASPKIGQKTKRAGDPTPTSLILATSRAGGCGASFVLPVGWQAQPAEPAAGKVCSLGLLPPDWAEFVSNSQVERGRYPITVQVSAQGLESTASSAGFSTRDGLWFVAGRAGSETQATRVEGKGWYGFLGEPTVGMHFKVGGYAGLGDTQRALVIAPDGRCAVLDVSVIEYMPVFARVLESFRFTNPQRPRRGV